MTIVECMKVKKKMEGGKFSLLLPIYVPAVVILDWHLPFNVAANRRTTERTRKSDSDPVSVGDAVVLFLSTTNKSSEVLVAHRNREVRRPVSTPTAVKNVTWKRSGKLGQA